MTTTTNLGIPLVDQSQAQKEVTINQAFTCLDAMIGGSVADKDLATPPGSPVTGVVYIVAASPTGAWSGRAMSLSYFDQVWRFIAPANGMRVWVRDEGQYYQYNGTSWIIVPMTGDMLKSAYDPANIAQQVVGTTATQTLSNKTISGASNSLTVRAANDITGTLPVANGGTGLVAFTDGQLLIGNSATGGLSKATITAGANVTVTNGNGTITIAASGGGAGTITGPGTSTSTAIAKWNGTLGDTLANSGVLIDASNNITGAGTLASGAHAITSTSSNALVVGAAGSSNPALQVDASVASSATGIAVQAAAAAGGVTIQALSSGANETLNIKSKGGGNIQCAGSGSISLQPSAVTRLLMSSTQSIFTSGTSSTAANVRFSYTGAADTALTASTEAPQVYWNLGQTRQHATGSLSLQRDFRVTGSVHSAVAASTFLDVAAFSVDGPVSAGTNATITNSHGIYMPTAALTGTVTNAYGLTVNAPSGATNNYAACLNGTVGIGTSAPSATALLDVSSTTKGFLPPRMTTAQKTAISSPTAGMVVFDTTLSKLSIFNGSVWDTATSGSGGTVSPLVCEGRLTLTSGTPVTSADVAGASTVYFTPYRGCAIALYDGTSSWNLLAFSELSISLASGYTSGKPYDVFAYNNAGTVALETGAWTNDSTRATAIVLQNGVYVKSGATTRRYLGTFYTTSATTTEDSTTKRLVWNYYNRIKRCWYKQQTAVASWTYTTAAFRQANNDVSLQLECMIGVTEDATEIAVQCAAQNTSAGVAVAVGIGINSATINAAQAYGTSTGPAGIPLAAHASIALVLGAGRYYFPWLEYSTATGTTTWQSFTGAFASSIRGSNFS